MYEFAHWVNSHTELSFSEYLVEKYTSLQSAAEEMQPTVIAATIEQSLAQIIRDIEQLSQTGYELRQYQFMQQELSND